ncbi:PH domain-containing protein [Mycolicibacterium brumae]|uniref:Low molecular weight protein antigen 6 PH domain-containing protein n=1 Tax=Mycolicibacterium brumae TaxID=85968 RepID=A0A2G5P9V2_9MYCO|nr:PH domain-containing protein [Mycolicibacterium brumae]MCV7193643.1 PH domain-containing protein [Mycolicibacterium brumae]PIB75037.1 hypothetical protein CQY22_010530 [Mycolicibacterium brumae]RWA17342.1 hypothetical protein MBRU_06870 [Mycolicibacterium brumae DSM 44177]UWW09084.1 PH domain-containing protein [Mycolicibacterium brumae]
MKTRAGDDTDWVAEFRPKRMPLLAMLAAVLILAVHVAVAASLRVEETGVNFRSWDQWAFVGMGVVVGGIVLLLTRPRLRVGPSGLAVRNVLFEKVIPWSQVVGVSFPAGKRWARIEMPGDEYVPVLAIQSLDKERAVDAMDRLRDLVAEHRA